MNYIKRQHYMEQKLEWVVPNNFNLSRLYRKNDSFFIEESLT